MNLATNTGQEIAEIVPEQHDDSVRFRKVITARGLLAIPALFIGQENVRRVGYDADLCEVLNRRPLLRARIRVAGNPFARPIRDKEDSNSGLPRSCNKFDDAGDGNGDMRVGVLVHLHVRKRWFVTHLKIDITDHGLVDIENNRGRQVFAVLLYWHRTPGLIVDETG